MTAENETTTWAAAHRACFETAPILEMRGAARVQVGFSVDFYAAFPMDREPGPERRDDALATWKRLRALLEELLPPPESRSARVEVEPMRPAAVLRPENEMRPEVVLTVRVYHPHDSSTPVAPDDRERLAVFEKQLVAMGLKAGRW